MVREKIEMENTFREIQLIKDYSTMRGEINHRAGKSKDLQITWAEG